MSVICFIFILLIIVLLPTFIYIFFILFKCPIRQPGSEGKSTDPKTGTAEVDLAVLTAKFSTKEAVEGGVCGGECAVCLSVFSDGEELRQLSVCKHLFHASCVDKWLVSHTSCPVCRGFVGSGVRHGRVVLVGQGQGVPDLAAMV